MPEEKTPEKKYSFFKQITPSNKGSFVPNFPLGAGQIDLNNFKNNTRHFEELATAFGIGKAKAQIIKNTMQFFATRPAPKKKPLEFPAVNEDNTGVWNTAVGTSVLGFPVFSNLNIKGDSYNNNQGETIAGFGDIRIDTVIFELSRDNNLVTTDMQGRDDTVIEYISAKSWNINCRGRIFSNRNGAYPYNDVAEFTRALNSNKSLQVDSWFLNMVGIYHIVIKKKSLPQEEGGIEYQKFEFEAIADNPIILRRPK